MNGSSGSFTVTVPRTGRAALANGGTSERWLDKPGVAEHFACSVRWIERRMEEGMPHRHIAGRAKFRLSEVEPWLRENGHIEWRGEQDG